MSYTAFDGHTRIASGTLAEAARAVKHAAEGLIFDDETGRVVDVDTRGTDEEVAARYAVPAEEPRKRGRPRLGVVAREVTLLPRHWEWLASQPGGASVALRRLVEDARRASAGGDRQRQSRDTAYRFISAIAGDLPGFEEISRALFANDPHRFRALMSAWPPDIRDHALHLASPE